MYVVLVFGNEESAMRGTGEVKYIIESFAAGNDLVHLCGLSLGAKRIRLPYLAV